MTPETPPAPTVTGEMREAICLLIEENPIELDDVTGIPIGREVEKLADLIVAALTKPAPSPSPNAPQAEAVVTEADREAALSVKDHPFDVRWVNGLGYSDRYFIKHGQADDHPLVQAFARYREAAIHQHQSEIEALREEVEANRKDRVHWQKCALENLEAVHTAEARATKAEAEKARLREVLKRYVDDCTNEECEFCINAREALGQARDAQG